MIKMMPMKLFKVILQGWAVGRTPPEQRGSGGALKAERDLYGWQGTAVSPKERVAAHVKNWPAWQQLCGQQTRGQRSHELVLRGNPATFQVPDICPLWLYNHRGGKKKKTD